MRNSGTSYVSSAITIRYEIIFFLFPTYLLNRRYIFIKDKKPDKFIHDEMKK